ncbi:MULTISPECIES: hypothetical protein [Clostridium]|uniref:Uncharacterized protein n=1 Tax=Clostridium cibarium TaxID=2762247 RepID=A0ABR8PYG0_9CLOT|nr:MULTISPECIES: hypothetical protein [Clostridium]MBD7913206.1 hypothetical protein [Clostridium cibarium]
MKNNKVSKVFNSILSGIVWAFGAFILAMIISKVTLYSFNDVFFVEGLILLGIGVLSSISEEELCGSLRGIGGLNYQYISNELQNARNENRIITLNTESINMELIIAGVLSFLILIF